MKYLLLAILPSTLASSSDVDEDGLMNELVADASSLLRQRLETASIPVSNSNQQPVHTSTTADSQAPLPTASTGSAVEYPQQTSQANGHSVGPPTRQPQANSSRSPPPAKRPTHRAPRRFSSDPLDDSGQVPPIQTSEPPVGSPSSSLLDLPVPPLPPVPTEPRAPRRFPTDQLDESSAGSQPVPPSPRFAPPASPRSIPANLLSQASRSPSSPRSVPGTPSHGRSPSRTPLRTVPENPLIRRSASTRLLVPAHMNSTSLADRRDDMLRVGNRAERLRMQGRPIEWVIPLEPEDTTCELVCQCLGACNPCRGARPNQLLLKPHEIGIAAISMFGDRAFLRSIWKDVRRGALKVLRSIVEIDYFLQEERLMADEPVPEEWKDVVYERINIPLLSKFSGVFAELLNDQSDRADKMLKLTMLDSFKQIEANMADFIQKQPSSTHSEWRLLSLQSKARLRSVSDGLAASLDEGPCLKILIRCGCRKPREIVVCK